GAATYRPSKLTPTGLRNRRATVTPTPTNPLHIGAFIAAATSKLRIGQCGTNLAAHHPLRVAEDAAMLDHMSQGRLDFGFMKGLSGKVSYQFDPNTAIQRDHNKTNGALTWEAFEIIKRFWSGKPFRFDGDYFTFPTAWDGSFIPAEHRDPRYYDANGTLTAIQGLPTPFQEPLPPCWTMVDSVASTVEAARRGVAATGWAQTFEGTRERLTAYRQAARETIAAGKMPLGANLRTAMMRPTFVANTREEADAVMRPALNGLFGKLFGLDNWLGRQAMLAKTEELTEEEKTCDWFDFFRKRDQIFVGTPEEVTELLKRYEQELGMQHLIMYWALPHVSFEQQFASIRLFADKVMPNFSADEQISALDFANVAA
ncbi:LLM class flavin-dependent oxidoreductase, partial [Novosphingobium album (ex Liu et al. 2023)]